MSQKGAGRREGGMGYTNTADASQATLALCTVSGGSGNKTDAMHNNIVLHII